jgi:uncharacterized membrane protein
MKSVILGHMKSLYFCLLLTLAGFAGHLSAQEGTRLTAEGPKVMAVGEVARLSYTINAKADDFNGPKIDGFLFSGPMLSTSMSTQIINNQVSQSVSYTYNYTLKSTVAGDFTIPPASAVVKGKTYTSEPVTIKVVKGDEQQQGGNQGGQAGQDQANLSNQDLFARVEVDRRQVYKGEQIFATIKIYARVNLARFGDMKMPSFAGFWNEEIPTPNQISLERTSIEGRIYNMGVIRKSILVPQKTGKITIDPFEIECFVNVQRRGQRSVFDDFFGSYETVSRTVKSPPVEITVKPLPPNPPSGFNGAVGKFTVTAGIDKSNVKTNDAVSLKVTVKGNGNLKLIDLPPFHFPADLEVYDPKVTDNITAGSNGLSGSKTFEYLIIPRHAGTFEIPAWNFSSFDPSTGNYKTFTSNPMKIDVSHGENDTSGEIMVTTPGKEDLRVIGNDIRFIKTGKPAFRTRGVHFFGSAGFFMIYVILLLIFTLTILFFRARFRNQADVEGSRYRRAISVSRKRLASARKALENSNQEEFLEALTRALWGYISDKFNLDASGLKRDSIRQLLLSRGVDEQIIRDFIDAIDRAEFMRFAPSAAGEGLQDLLTQSENMIISIEKTYRR